MKLFFTVLWFISALWFNCAFSQTPSSCNVPQEIQEAYTDDVHFLAMMRLYEIESEDIAHIMIPQSYKDSIWEGLAAIYNAFSIPERDTIFDIYCIHQWMGTPSFFYITEVYVDTNYGWTDNWQNMELITGYSELDNLLNDYEFNFTNYSSYFNIASIITSQQINIRYFNDSLEQFDGITNAFSSYNGDGNEIYYYTNGNNREFEFTLGYGDCPLGCLAKRKWKFTVLPDCSVWYTGFVDFNPEHIPLPEPENCNISIDILEHNVSVISIFPNPATKEITIDTQIINNKEVIKIRICDTMGKVIYKNDNANSKISVDISHFTEGIYVIQLQSQQGLVSRKFVKL